MSTHATYTDATLLGAVGAEDIPDDVTLWGLLIPIRQCSPGPEFAGSQSSPPSRR